MRTGKRNKMPRNYFLINILFLVIIGLLSFTFYKTWTKPYDIPDRSTVTLKDAAKGPVPFQEEKIIESSFQAISEKDLFRPSRASAPETASSKPLSSRESPRLFGTMIMNNKNVAILEDPSTRTTKLYYVNDSISGFVITDIEKEKVTLTKGTDIVEIKLRDNKGFKSSGSTSARAKHRVKPRPRSKTSAQERKSRRTRRPVKQPSGHSTADFFRQNQNR